MEVVKVKVKVIKVKATVVKVKAEVIKVKAEVIPYAAEIGVQVDEPIKSSRLNGDYIDSMVETFGVRARAINPGSASTAYGTY